VLQCTAVTCSVSTAARCEYGTICTRALEGGVTIASRAPLVDHVLIDGIEAHAPDNKVTCT
jgi:hypothetical protein